MGLEKLMNYLQRSKIRRLLNAASIEPFRADDDEYVQQFIRNQIMVSSIYTLNI
jgi:hypothetical protein